MASRSEVGAPPASISATGIQYAGEFDVLPLIASIASGESAIEGE